MMSACKVVLPTFATPSANRSRNMAAIKSRGNRTTERRLRALLVGAGIGGWTLHGTSEMGSPDFVFRRPKIVIFVHGCFWHGCPRCGHVPKTNSPYWIAKLARNRRRDQRAYQVARSRGYTVVRVWECELRKRPELCISRIRSAIIAASTRAPAPRGLTGLISRSRKGRKSYRGRPR